MHRVNASQLKEGQTVAADLRNHEDALLVPAGTSLSPRLIQRLQSWGIREIPIHDPTPSSAETDPDLLNLPSTDPRCSTVESVRQRFYAVDPSSPIQREILRLAIQRALHPTPPPHPRHAPPA